MDVRIQEIVDFTADKFKLEAFYLKRHAIYREKIDQNGESFVLNMEWFPNDAIISDEDLNPAGTISIDIDIHSKLIRRLIFVEGENKLETDLPKAGNTELAPGAAPVLRWSSALRWAQRLARRSRWLSCALLCVYEVRA